MTNRSNLAGAGEQRRGHIEAQRLRGLEIDDQLKLGRPQHRQVARFGAFEDLAGIDAGLARRIRNAGAIAHQTAGLGELAQLVYRGNGVACRQCNELRTPGEEKGIRGHQERFEPLLNEDGESRVDAVLALRFQDQNLFAENTGSRRYFL